MQSAFVDNREVHTHVGINQGRLAGWHKFKAELQGFQLIELARRGDDLLLVHEVNAIADGQRLSTLVASNLGDSVHVGLRDQSVLGVLEHSLAARDITSTSYALTRLVELRRTIILNVKLGARGRGLFGCH